MRCEDRRGEQQTEHAGTHRWPAWHESEAAGTGRLPGDDARSPAQDRPVARQYSDRPPKAECETSCRQRQARAAGVRAADKGTGRRARGASQQGRRAAPCDAGRSPCDAGSFVVRRGVLHRTRPRAAHGRESVQGAGGEHGPAQSGSSRAAKCTGTRPARGGSCILPRVERTIVQRRRARAARVRSSAAATVLVASSAQHRIHSFRIDLRSARRRRRERRASGERSARRSLRRRSVSRAQEVDLIERPGRRRRRAAENRRRRARACRRGRSSARLALPRQQLVTRPRVAQSNDRTPPARPRRGHFPAPDAVKRPERAECARVGQSTAWRRGEARSPSADGIRPFVSGRRDLAPPPLLRGTLHPRLRPARPRSLAGAPGRPPPHRAIATARAVTARRLSPAHFATRPCTRSFPDPFLRHPCPAGSIPGSRTDLPEIDESGRRPAQISSVGGDRPPMPPAAPPPPGPPGPRLAGGP
jgi:hypothetical protein